MFRKKIEIERHEHIYRGRHYNINYLEYAKKGSRHLLVTLSGFNGSELEGRPAKYNYMRTLSGFPVNKLFIKDEVDDIPVYYYGEGGDTYYLDEVCRLIEDKCKEMGVQKEQLIIAGSSKGGTGALLIGFRLGAGHVISGANQLDVGSYLYGLNEKLRNLLLMKMVGSIGEEEVHRLDQNIRKLILVERTKSRLYFHAGNEDAHYYQHMQPMLKHFDQHGILYELELRSYAGHENVKHYFPQFFRRKVSEIVTLPFLEVPRIKSKGDNVEVHLKIGNIQKNMDWAFYVYKKDGKVIKVMYNTETHHVVKVAYEEIKSIKLFLRVHEEKKQVKEFFI